MSYSRVGGRIRGKAKRRRASAERHRRIAGGQGAWRGPDPDLMSDGGCPDPAGHEDDTPEEVEPWPRASDGP